MAGVYEWETHGTDSGKQCLLGTKVSRKCSAHQQRMAAINARGQATRSLGNTFSEILDINHSGYLNRSNMVDAGHVNTINMIGQQTIISNSGTGERYKVEDNSRYYWVNKKGEYIGTN